MASLSAPWIRNGSGGYFYWVACPWFWLTARVLVFESSSRWHTFLFLMLFCSNSAHFSEIQLVCDGPTDGRTDGRTDGPTDGRTDGRTYPLIEMRERI